MEPMHCPSAATPSAYRRTMAEEPWVTKLERAQEHIAALKVEIEDMQYRGALAIAVERNGPDHVLRAVVPEPISPRLSAVVGDALHNTRSALDLFASALWPHRVGRPLTKVEEAAVAFPITATPRAFDDWLRRMHRTLPQLDEDTVGHLRWVQPWYYDEQAAIVLNREPEWPDRRFSLLLRLADLNNIDKHRRLAVVAVFPQLLAAGHDSGRELRWRPGRQRLANGVEIGRWIPPDGDPDMTIEHMGDLSLVLELDLAARMTDPVTEVLDSMVGQVRIVLHQLTPLVS